MTTVRDECFGDERTIRSLSGRTGISRVEVRTLFSQEFARLELGARVRSYLPALTASSVRALLRHAHRVGGERGPTGEFCPVRRLGYEEYT